MRKPTTLLMIAIICVMGMAAVQAISDDGNQPSEQEFFEKWNAFMTPGPEHKLLESRVGTWNFTIKMWMAPGAPPSESTGTAVFKMVMGGRYLVDETESSVNGMPFLGMGMVGYDNLRKKYVSTWIDTMGTGIMPAEGTYDKATKTFHYTAKSPDLLTGKTKKTRIVERTISADTFVAEMYDITPDGKEFKNMEITYHRAAEESSGAPVVHFEIGCRELDKTQKFFTDLFGWKTQPYGPSNAMIATGGEGGISGHFTALGHEPHHFVNVYVQVDDLQAHLDKAEKLGGKTVIPPQEVPGAGHFAWFNDLDGNTLGLWKPVN